MLHTHLPRSSDYVYCPRCGARLVERQAGGKIRQACPACDFVYYADPKVGVGVVVLEGGKILLVQRNMNPERGKWSLPAGFVDHGEDPAAVAVRETLEETGLEVTVTGLVDVYYNPPDSPAGGGASIFILYQARRRGGALQAGDDADAAGFFALDELPELAFHSTRSVIERLQG